MSLPHAPTSLPLSPGQGVYSAWLMGGEAGAGREPRFCSLLNTVFTVKIVAFELKVQTSAIRKPCLRGPAFPVPVLCSNTHRWGGTRRPEAAPMPQNTPRYSEFKNLAGCLSPFGVRILGSCSFGNWDTIAALRGLVPRGSQDSPLHTSRGRQSPCGVQRSGCLLPGGWKRFGKSRASNLTSVRTRALPRLTLPVHFG